jgi:uncharacterized protein (DUF433 family)
MPDREVFRKGASWIEKAEAVCGGRARVRTTRLPVWSIVRARQLGATDQELLNYFVAPLTQADLDVAWAYYEQNREEIEHDLWQNSGNA